MNLLKEYIKQVLHQELMMEKQRFAKETGERIDPLASIFKWKGDPWVFVHFSKVPKIGIYPNKEKMMENETPAGIYAYPIDFVLKQGGDMEHIPYQSSSRYIYIFRLKPSAQSRAVTMHIDKSVTLGKGLDPDFDEYAFYSVWESFKGQGNPITWRNELVKANGISAIIDLGSGQIHYHEKIQAVFFSTKDIEIIDMIDQGKEGTAYTQYMGNNIILHVNETGVMTAARNNRFQSYQDSKTREWMPSQVWLSGRKDWHDEGKLQSFQDPVTGEWMPARIHPDGAKEWYDKGKRVDNPETYFKDLEGIQR